MFKIINRVTVLAFLFALVSCSFAGCGKKNSDPVQMDSSSYKKFARINVADYGSMEFGLLDTAEPETVHNFISLAQSGFFENKPVYMVIKDFCMMAGNAGNEEDEVNSAGNMVEEMGSAQVVKDDKPEEDKPVTYPFRGALCITEQSSDKTPAKFTVIQTPSDFLKELKEMLEYKKVTPAEYYEQAYGVKLDDDILELFDKYGGTPWLYGHCIVFGQLTAGEDVLDSICRASVYDDAEFKPVEDILIESVEVFEKQ